MSIVLDAGALIALDRGDRDVWLRLQTAFENGDRVRVPAGVIGQAWRDPSRQVLLSRSIKRCDEMPLDGSTARTSGWLCGLTNTADVIDASVAVIVSYAMNRDPQVVLLTSDTRDLQSLLSALDAVPRIVKV
ncbi:MAG: twitching motility protein PilT [bacterium]|nr:twitching motility protein PilT [bacterium]